ncbi:MAG: hypothetical protein ACRDHN_04755 [Thermomicrobiales bacterium]
MRLRWVFMVLALMVAMPVVEVLAGAGDSRENPVPFGQPGRIGDWEITVTGTDLNASKAIAMATGHVLDLESGHVFVLVQLSLTRVGSDSGSFVRSLLSSAVVGPSNVAYDDLNAGCDEVPGTDDDTLEVFPGGTLTTALCWQVLRADAASADDLVMFITSDRTSERVFFSLDMPVATPVATPGV